MKPLIIELGDCESSSDAGKRILRFVSDEVAFQFDDKCECSKVIARF